MTVLLRSFHVLAVPDVVKTTNYFVMQLGFKVAPVVDAGWRFLNRDACRIMIGDCPDAQHPSALGDHNYFGYFVVENIDKLAAEYRDKEVVFKSDVEDKPWGMREFAVETPDGHRMMFGQEIAMVET